MGAFKNNPGGSKKCRKNHIARIWSYELFLKHVQWELTTLTGYDWL